MKTQEATPVQSFILIDRGNGHETFYGPPFPDDVEAALDQEDPEWRKRLRRAQVHGAQ